MKYKPFNTYYYELLHIMMKLLFKINLVTE